MATLSCVTSDTRTPVAWKRKNVVLLAGEKYELRKEGKLNLLLIHSVEKEDTGLYTCDTGDMQCSATLTVKGNMDPRGEVFRSDKSHDSPIQSTIQ